MILVDSEAAPQPTLVFFHIPKAGGSTLHKIIDHQDYPGLSWSGHGTILRERLLQAPQAEREQVRVLKGHMSFGIHEFLPFGATYLTMLREPVERTVSFYYYVQTDRAHTHHQTIVEGNLSLRDCIEQRISQHGFFNGQTHMLAGWEIDRTEFEARGPEMLDRARRHLQDHFVVAGTMERFDETLMLLRRRLSWGMPFYRRENVSRTRPRTPLAPETASLIREGNPLDVALYQHVSQGFAAEISSLPAAFGADLARFRRLNAFYQQAPGPVCGAMRRLARALNRHRRHSGQSALRRTVGAVSIPLPL